MAEEIALNMKVGVADGKRSVADLRNEMKTLTDEVNNTERGTDAYAKAIQRLGDTKAELKDLKEDISALDPDAKAKAFIGLGQTMVAGFTAAQGAAALFGSENEDIQKGILKMQALIGILHGVQAAADAKDQVARLRIIALRQLEIIEAKRQLVVTEGMTIAQRVLNAVMAANPAVLVAGAVIALTGAVVAFTMASKDNNEELKRSNELLKEGEQALKDYKKAGEDAQFELSLREKNLTEFNKKEARLERETKQEIEKLRDEYKKKTIDGIYQTSAEQEIAYQNLMSNELALWDGHYAKLDLLREDENAKAKSENQKAADERLKQEKEESKKLIEERKARMDAIVASLEAQQAQEQRAADSYMKMLVDEAEKVQTQKRDEMDTILQMLDEQQANEKAKTDSFNAVKLADEEFLRNAKIGIANDTLSALSALGDLAIRDEQKRVEFQKKIAIAQIALDTAISVAKAIRDGNRIGVTPVDKAILIASNVALVLGAFAKIKGILQQGNIQGGAPSSSFGGGVSGGSSPRIESRQENVNTTRLGQEQSGIGAPQEIRVTVLESDITNTQDRVRVIQSRSTF